MTSRFRPKQLALDSNGDLIYQDSGQTVVLPIGLNGEMLSVLDATAGSIGWGPAGAAHLFTCPVAVAIADVVYISGSGSVDKASTASGSSTGPSVGVVRSKPTTTTALVAFAGVAGGFSGLSAGSIYYQDDSTPGGVTITPPSTIGALIHRIGVAVSATDLVVDINHPVLVV